MSTKSISEITHKRLEAYGLFNSKVVDAVAKQAGVQADFESYEAFFKKVGVPLEPTLFITDKGRGVPLIDVDARETQQGVLVVHLPMGNSLDTNQLYQVATIAFAFPSYRIIAFGNPSGKPFAYREQNLSFSDWLRVSFTKKRRAAVSTELEYLHSQGVTHAVHIGYSFGAMKALLTAYYADADDVDRLILVDPVAHSRYTKQLLEDFQSTFKPLGEYVNRTRLQTFFDARKDAEQVRMTRGIMRPVNIAYGLMLGRLDFISLLKETLAKLSNLKVAVAWGAKSELGNDAHIKANLHVLQHDTAKGRVVSLRLPDDTHAFANDIYLYVAIIKQALLG